MKDTCLWKAKELSSGLSSLTLSLIFPASRLFWPHLHFFLPRFHVSSYPSLALPTCVFAGINLSLSVQWQNCNLRRVV